MIQEDWNYIQQRRVSLTENPKSFGVLFLRIFFLKKERTFQINESKSHQEILLLLITI
ncbi:hypothetical protein LEP1GSC021_4876 [Leptospira noguchii str. 1993005606]|uniref:Uncharacterized protein n=2 Tax=Leptospira noguchii TaxID=28182 RepID=M6YFA3_9LEPT|nr:hypothetical protein LEP1GSC035_1522 [Leptospira noguchii str. 2007001578]EMO88324.1 hypothetical protein LEP1GSC024_3706 [Leptospira noguchii str. 2001034031]EPE85168.1 hypothetical protein LEP1GSC021_4876 [Leptospira noguchii str. 1993005606]